MTRRTDEYKILWIVDKCVREEINKDNPIPRKVARWKIEQMKRTTHRSGELILVHKDISIADALVAHLKNKQTEIEFPFNLT